jgi:hypothetical protein
MYSQKVSTQAPPIDLADGRFETRAAALRVAFAVGMFIVAAVGVWGALWVWPTYGDPSAAQVVGVALFAGVAGVALWFGVLAVRLQFRAWTNYQAFLDDTRDAYLNAYNANDGQEIQQEVRMGEINPRDIRDMLTLLCYVYLTRRVTIGQLKGNLLLPTGSRMVSLGTLSDYSAEVATKTLERSGVLLPGRQGQSRQLADAELGDLVVQLANKWGKE